MNALPILALLLLASASASQTAAAATCPADHYGVLTSTTAPRICLPWPQAPGPVSVNCFRTLQGFSCSAWPRSADNWSTLRYRWVGEGDIDAGSSDWTTSHTRTLTCGDGFPTPHGYLTLTVRSPFGMSASTSLALNCGSNITQ